MDGTRMRWPAAVDLRLPALLVAGQVAVWPLGPLLFGAAVDTSMLVPVAGITAVIAVALCWRVVAPVASLALAIAATRVATPAGLDELAIVMMFGDLIALYGVALRRTLRVSLPWLAIATVTAALAEASLREPAPVVATYFVLSGAMYSIVVAFGRSRRHRAARREAVRARLARTAEEERAAAAAERERLTHELHDVSAHHLTAAVVQLAAAQRLREPAMVAQALGVAGPAGRQTAGALHRLVALADDPEALSVAGIADLVAGFGRLGLPVDLRLDARPVRREVAEAAYRIVQEALTNTMRYAPSAAITVSVTQTAEALTVAVDDTGSDAGGGFDLGSGSGIPGMRARAAGVGGTVACGPSPSGGWSVRAVLPLVPAVRQERQDRQERRGGRPWWRAGHARVFDLVLMACVVAVPLLLQELARFEDGGSAFGDPAEAGAALLFLSAYGGPLWWRRRAPVAVLGGMLAILLAGAALSRAGVPLPGVAVAIAGLAAPIYAVGRYGTGHPGVSWMAAAGAGLGVAVALLVAFAEPAEVMPAGGPPVFRIAGVMVLAGLAGAALSVVTVPFWLAGWLVARHRSRAAQQERVALRDVAERAAQAARAERVRIAEGLRGQVLQHAYALTEAAEGKRTDAALAHARAALAAMRELLTVLRVGTAEPTRAAVPSLAGLPALCRQGGREPATLELAGDEGPVPPEVELCAYRIVEAVLPIGGPNGGPIQVRLDRQPDALRLSVDRLHRQPSRTVLAALRERVDAVGGSLAGAPAGTDGWRLDVSLPMTEVVPT